MSILIKGMEMPTHCMDCPFMVSRDNDDCILQSAEANESFENWEQMRAGCPLIPAPPHGRLGDLDALMDIPTADVRPVRRGKWLDMGDFISCSSCNATRLKEFESDYGKVMRLDARTNFCPNCGADMRGEQDV